MDLWWLAFTLALHKRADEAPVQRLPRKDVDLGDSASRRLAISLDQLSI